MAVSDQFCLRWNDHQNTLLTTFDTLLDSQKLTDVTLWAGGKCLKAHKVVLSACSPYFDVSILCQYCFLIYGLFWKNNCSFFS